MSIMALALGGALTLAPIVALILCSRKDLNALVTQGGIRRLRRLIGITDQLRSSLKATTA